MATPTMAGSVVEEGSLSAVSWGAVIAGGVASLAVTLVLLAFGIGVGFSVVSPWTDQGVSGTTFHVGAGIYLIVVAMLSSTVGGYIAGRLRNRWAGVHHDEVYFRDTAHGFMAWALATVVGAAMLGGAATHITAGATAGSVPAAAAASANSAASPTDIYVDTLLRNDAPTPAGGAATTPVTTGNGATRAELGRLMAQRHAKGRRSDRRRPHLCREGRVGSHRAEPARSGKARQRHDRRGQEGGRRCAQIRRAGWRCGSQPRCWLVRWPRSWLPPRAGCSATRPGTRPGWRPGPYGTERDAALSSLSNWNRRHTHADPLVAAGNAARPHLSF